ncbi:MAG TPA: peptidylprolyl isomerase [Solirubrobacteraceae bacterium]|jgi:hypothetical protein
MAAIAPEHVLPDPPRYTECISRQQALTLTEGSTTGIKQECERQYRSLQRRSLEWLIAWQWLRAEAARRHLAIPDHPGAVHSNSPRHELAVTSTNSTQARAELTAEKLQEFVAGGVTPVTNVQVASYYRQHLARFETPENRYLDIAEGFTATGAAQYRRQVAAGTTSLSATSLHEDVIGTTGGVSPNTRRAALRAILSARPRILSAPILLNKAWAVFEITRIVPRTRIPLARVAQTLKARLEKERQDQALERFIASWRRTWLARTNCEPGYIVQKCRQYKGPRAAEEPLVFE